MGKWDCVYDHMSILCTRFEEQFIKHRSVARKGDSSAYPTWKMQNLSL